jgi:hypothetical protein
MRRVMDRLAWTFGSLAITLLLLSVLAVPTTNIYADGGGGGGEVVCDVNGGTGFCNTNFHTQDDCNITHHDCDDQPGCQCHWVINPPNNSESCACQSVGN